MRVQGLRLGAPWASWGAQVHWSQRCAVWATMAWRVAFARRLAAGGAQAHPNLYLAEEIAALAPPAAIVRAVDPSMEQGPWAAHRARSACRRRLRCPVRSHDLDCRAAHCTLGSGLDDCGVERLCRRPPSVSDRIGGRRRSICSANGGRIWMSLLPTCSQP